MIYRPKRNVVFSVLTVDELCDHVTTFEHGKVHPCDLYSSFLPPTPPPKCKILKLCSPPKYSSFYIHTCMPLHPACYHQPEDQAQLIFV